MLNKKYIYPYLNGGEVVGINNSGIESFSKRPNNHIVKETIQNSLDAKLDNKNLPVKVCFKLLRVNREAVPDIDGTISTLISCKKYHDSDKKAKCIIDDALNILQCDKINILEISDYNTTGLKGAKSKENNNFNNLVRASGVSNKGGEEGGSFGIGKNAAFACSKLRTVIYSTLDYEGTFALQGVARWATHIFDGKETQGVGYLSVLENNNNDVRYRPFLDDEVKIFDDIFIRKEIGTSLFVLGFNDSYQWKKDFIKATIENYFLAILNGDLEVVIEDTIINKSTIDEIIDVYLDLEEDSLTLGYYRALMHGKKFEYIIEDLGVLKLSLILGNDYDKKVAYVRSNGMKIIDKGGLRIATPFTGVLSFDGVRLNSFIKSLENVSHDNIIVDKVGDSKYNNKIIKEIEKFIRDSIKQSIDERNINSINIEWLAESFPNSREKDELNNNEGINKKLDEVKLIKLPYMEKKKNRRGGTKVKKGKGNEENSRKNVITGVGNEVSTYQGGYGNITVSGNGANTGVRVLQVGGDKGNQSIKVSEESMKYQDVIIKRRRVFYSGNINEYIAVIESSNDCTSKLELSIIGEDCKKEKATIVNAVDINNNKAIEVDGDVIGPINFKKNSFTKIKLKLNTINKCSLEVNCYENKK
ncbi:hypothetical protein [Clostridium perfringens]|uniref:hypothetical protein n=1 Tax=Clostridium perfringens TaxID=1502 RepID=UPI001CCA9F3D|nr:hypothetical protein [Clostridium perfringens]UBK56479.1 hypothetical protein KLF47_04430 [Clostridium perfringens]